VLWTHERTMDHRPGAMSYWDLNYTDQVPSLTGTSTADHGYSSRPAPSAASMGSKRRRRIDGIRSRTEPQSNGISPPPKLGGLPSVLCKIEQKNPVRDKGEPQFYARTDKARCAGTFGVEEKRCCPLGHCGFSSANQRQREEKVVVDTTPLLLRRKNRQGATRAMGPCYSFLPKIIE
jgi:hypothetical protein